MLLAPFSFFSKYLAPKSIGIFIIPRDGYFRGLIRSLYEKHVDELYIPKGTRASICYDNNRKPAREGHGCITLSASAPRRRGLQEVSFFEEFNYTR